RLKATSTTCRLRSNRGPTLKAAAVARGHRGFVWVVFAPWWAGPAFGRLQSFWAAATPSRPQHGGPLSVARRRGQGWRVSATEGLSLTAASTAESWPTLGRR